MEAEKPRCVSPQKPLFCDSLDICFDPEKIDAPEWDGFGSYRFVLPEYELIRQGDAFTIVWNVLSESESDVLRLKLRFRDFIRRSISSEDKTKDRLSHRNRENAFLREDTPSEKEWIALSQQLIESMKAGEVEKVVLAHKVDLTFEKPLDPIRLLESVRSQSVQTYSFLFRFPGSGVFLGGSPERLFKKDGCTIFSEAIAGTRPVAKDRDKNIKLQKELLQSAKELQEHAYVTDDIEAALKSICEDIHSNQSSEIVAAASVQHLLTPFQGTLKKQTTLHEIISAIHPTAAVNGVPAQKATEQIRSREPFCRGWYAGPVGWVMADEAEFAAAIRSALVQDQRIISIYGGAGLVKDSVPEQEWEETEHKIRLILDAAKKNIG